MNKTQLTKEGFDKLQEERKELVEVKRQKAVERLSSARSMGDLKENSEYHAARDELSFVEGRITEIEALLKTAEVVNHDTRGDNVELGKKVTIEVAGNRQEFTIVGEFEADLSLNKLSSASPIGHALIGHKSGESVEIAIPAGRATYKIVSVR